MQRSKTSIGHCISKPGWISFHSGLIILYERLQLNRNITLLYWLVGFLFLIFKVRPVPSTAYYEYMH